MFCCNQSYTRMFIVTDVGMTLPLPQASKSPYWLLGPYCLLRLAFTGPRRTLLVIRALPVTGDFWLLGIGYWVLGMRYWVLGIVYWVLRIGYWMLSIGYWVLGMGYWVLGIG